MDKKKYFNLIDECSENCQEKYCFFKKFIESLHPHPRTLCQLKCMEKMKWIWSKEENQDIGWDVAGYYWVERGYAKTFSKVYDEEETINNNFKKIMDVIKSQ